MLTKTHLILSIILLLIVYAAPVASEDRLTGGYVYQLAKTGDKLECNIADSTTGPSKDEGLTFTVDLDGIPRDQITIQAIQFYDPKNKETKTFAVQAAFENNMLIIPVTRSYVDSLHMTQGILLLRWKKDAKAEEETIQCGKEPVLLFAAKGTGSKPENGNRLHATPWLKPQDADKWDPQVTYIDAARGQPERISGPTVITPNTEIKIVVRKQETDRISIKINGKQGLLDPRSTTKRETGAEEQGRPVEGKTVKVEEIHCSFPPYLPGDANIEVEVYFNPDKKDSDRKEIFGLIVKNAYFGAVRLGIAAVMGAAVDQSYYAKTMPGSSQREIAAHDQNWADGELVVGYSFYIPALRTYPRTDACDYLKNFWGIYAGFGTVGTGGDESDPIKLLKSFYLGVDMEPHPNLSIVVAATLRQVTRLDKGEKVGYALGENDDLPTSQVWRAGPAVLINFSPDIFKTMRKGLNQ